MKAIPTPYGGCRFRSRLEARWAAFFDLAALDWDYEPIDLDGWAPDFSIHSAGETVYAEVKPVEMEVDPQIPPDWPHWTQKRPVLSKGREVLENALGVKAGHVPASRCRLLHYWGVDGPARGGRPKVV